MADKIPVPFLDLSRIHKPIEEELVSVFKNTLARNAFINSDELKCFETDFANWVGTKFCKGISSGLDALTISLRAMGLQKGDRVLVPAMTFVATVEAVTHAGGSPVLVDVDAQGLMDLSMAETLIKKENCKFLIPVHLFGQAVDLQKLQDLGTKTGVTILEDACQAHGAKCGGLRVGTIGKASAFSFYPGKNLGALGDAGALCTNDQRIFDEAKALHEHGQTKKYYHVHEGYTARLDNLQAGFLGVKLKRMDEWTRQRISAAKAYGEELQGLKNATLQSVAYDGSHVFHLYVLLTKKREALAKAFEEAKIGYGMHYPIPIHKLPCYEGRGWIKGSFPNAERYADEGISLPMFAGIRPDEIKAVCEIVKKFCS